MSTATKPGRGDATVAERVPPSTGVQTAKVSADEAGMRVDRFLEARFPGLSFSHIQRVIRKGELRVNGKRARPEQRLIAGDRVRVPPVHERSVSAQSVASGGVARVPPALVARVLASIIHEDERVLVLDKPAGLAVHGGSGLTYGVIEALRAARPNETLELAHRLLAERGAQHRVRSRGSAMAEGETTRTG